jgi:hypothetical protein
METECIAMEAHRYNYGFSTLKKYEVKEIKVYLNDNLNNRNECTLSNLL